MSTQTSSSINPHPTLHFTSRSKEFLSCAKTAARVVDPSISPSTLQLHPPETNAATTTQAFSSISDALSLLSHSDSILSQLEILVKRRGHTNDPSDDIQLSLSKFEAISSNLATLVTTIALDGRGGSEQRRRHYELVGQRVRDMGKERVDKLKSLMEIRGEVIKSQTRRRKLLDAADKRTASTSGRSSSLSTSVNNYSQLSSPLFTMTGRSNKTSSSSAPNSSTTKPAISTAPPSNGAGSHKQPPPTATPAYGGYSHQHSAPTYGGYYNNNYAPPSNGTGMRRRNNANSTTVTTNPHHLPPPNDPASSHQQQQTYMRSTRTRLDEAQNAERTLSELTKVFSKMADLITTQSEVLEKIEDDVEAAHGHVEKGQQEIFKLYEVTRGNRGLILKVFGVLIGLIVFMRLY